VTPPRFDWLAPHYAWVERLTYGGWLHRCRTALLGELTDARRVLILGEGDGRFLADFLKANPVATVDVIDASAGMVALARQRLRRVPGAADRVSWHVADARRFDFPPASYDLIVTNFFLDCFPASELEPLVSRLAQCLSPGGRWLVGDFALPSGRVRRLFARLALVGMYAFFAVGTGIPAVRLADPTPLLLAEGLRPEREAHLLGGFLMAQQWRAPG